MATTTSLQKINVEGIHFPFNKLLLREAIERINTYSPQLMNKSITLNNSVHTVRELFLTPVKSKNNVFYDIKIDFHPEIPSPILLDALLMHLKINDKTKDPKI
ncbi:MAG TPA: hypothetical protein VLB84_00250 [Bacteroidia bacterium]|nr:hypothetical protein [Bacteroidia bacterium]